MPPNVDSQASLSIRGHVDCGNLRGVFQSFKRRQFVGTADKANFQLVSRRLRSEPRPIIRKILRRIKFIAVRLYS